jgi:hypothetical protein
VPAVCEQTNDISSSVGIFLRQLSDYKLSKKDRAPRNKLILLLYLVSSKSVSWYGADMTKLTSSNKLM